MPVMHTDRQSELNLLSLASSILERAAIQEEVFVKHNVFDSPTGVDSRGQLSAEYFILRLALVSLQFRL